MLGHQAPLQQFGSGQHRTRDGAGGSRAALTDLLAPSAGTWLRRRNRKAAAEPSGLTSRKTTAFQPVIDSGIPLAYARPLPARARVAERRARILDGGHVLGLAGPDGEPVPGVGYSLPMDESRKTLRRFWWTVSGGSEAIYDAAAVLLAFDPGPEPQARQDLPDLAADAKGDVVAGLPAGIAVHDAGHFHGQVVPLAA